MAGAKSTLGADVAVVTRVWPKALEFTADRRQVELASGQALHGSLGYGPHVLDQLALGGLASLETLGDESLSSLGELHQSPEDGLVSAWAAS